jgi:hypothetical protein
MPKATLPPPAPELREGEKFKEIEQKFLEEQFGEKIKPKEPILTPEPPPLEPEKPATPPVGEQTPPADPPKKDEKPEEKPAAPAADTDALTPEGNVTPDPEEKPEEKPVEKPAPAAVSIDTDQIIEGVADRLEQRLKAKEQATPAPDPLAKYSDSDRSQLRVLAHLQKSDKYKGRDLVKETTAFWDAESAYIAQWERENPGKRFNETDEEHEAFYAKATPSIPDEDLDDARLDIKVTEKAEKIAEEKLKERMAPIEQKVRETERQQREAAAEKVIAKSIDSAVVQVAMEAVPEFKEILKDGKLTKEAVDAMAEKDPAAVKAINKEARSLKVLVREVERMEQLGDHWEFNPNLRLRLADETVIRPHQEIVEVAVDLEQRMLDLPKDSKDRIRDGKKWMPKHVIDTAIEQALQQNDTKRIDAILDSYWIIGAGDIKGEIQRRAAQRVKETLEIANARSAPAAKKNPESGKTVTPPVPPPKPANAGGIKPPSTSSASDMVDSGIPKVPGSSSPDKDFAKWSFPE